MHWTKGHQRAASKRDSTGYLLYIMWKGYLWGLPFALTYPSCRCWSKGRLCGRPSDGCTKRSPSLVLTFCTVHSVLFLAHQLTNFSGFQCQWNFCDQINYDRVTVKINSKHSVHTIEVGKGLNFKKIVTIFSRQETFSTFRECSKSLLLHIMGCPIWISLKLEAAQELTLNNPAMGIERYLAYISWLSWWLFSH